MILLSGKGFADLAFIPLSGNSSKPAMIVEFKYDKSAETAIDQKNKTGTSLLIEAPIFCICGNYL